MKKIFGFSQKEIARELSLSESTVEKHVAKGMLVCMRYLQSNGCKQAEKNARDKANIAESKAEKQQ